MFEGIGSGDSIAGYVADVCRGTAGRFELFDSILREYHLARVDESFVVVGGCFGSHDCVFAAFGAFGNVPVDGFEGGAELPEVE